MNPAEGSHGDVGMVSKGDVVLALSNSGDTEEITRILPTLKRLDIKIIGMTGNAQSVLAKASDVSLDVSVKEEACPMGIRLSLLNRKIASDVETLFGYRTGQDADTPPPLATFRRDEDLLS